MNSRRHKNEEEGNKNIFGYDYLYDTSIFYFIMMWSSSDFHFLLPLRILFNIVHHIFKN